MPILQLEKAIARFVSDFLENPFGIFNERELHAHFFGLCRTALGTADTKDGKTVHLFRHEYNSIWRYKGDDDYKDQHDDGTALSLDCALLHSSFVQGHRHLTVVNKDEDNRVHLRKLPMNADGTSPVIHAGIEFKMAHVVNSMQIQECQISALKELMRKDCRKLAHERVGVGYILAFSHGGLKKDNRTKEIVNECIEEYKDIFRDGVLRVALVSPHVREMSDNWLVELPSPPQAVEEPAESALNTGQPLPACPPLRGMEYMAPGNDGTRIRVRVCNVGDRNSRVYSSSRFEDSFLVANDDLEPVEIQTPAPLDLLAGQEYRYEANGQEIVRATILNVGPCNSRVKLIDGTERLVPNHWLQPIERITGQ